MPWSNFYVHIESGNLGLSYYALLRKSFSENQEFAHSSRIWKKILVEYECSQRCRERVPLHTEGKTVRDMVWPWFSGWLSVSAQWPWCFPGWPIWFLSLNGVSSSLTPTFLHCNSSFYTSVLSRMEAAPGYPVSTPLLHSVTTLPFSKFAFRIATIITIAHWLVRRLIEVTMPSTRKHVYFFMAQFLRPYKCQTWNRYLLNIY